MANYFDEGNIATGGKPTSTNEWLKSNNLSHLIPVFNQNNISLSELAEMPRDELTEILKALGLDAINIPRVRSKIMKLKNNKQNDNNIPPQSHHKPQRVIITEAETTALNSLDSKYNELSSEKKSIEDRLSEFEIEYIKQQKILNSSFNEIISNIENRRNILLNEMKQKGDGYKYKLSQQMKSVANQRSILNKIKNKCENNINNSSVSSLQGARQRSNKTVALIDETLLSVVQNHNFKKPKHNINVQFNISKSKINAVIKKWGLVKIIGDKAPPPKINFVKVLGNNMIIELLCDENYDKKVSKYEINISPQIELQRRDSIRSVESMDNFNAYNNNNIVSNNLNPFNIDSDSEPVEPVTDSDSTQSTKSTDLSDFDFKPVPFGNDEKKQNEQYTVRKVKHCNNNIAFYELKELQQGTEYKIRGRAILEGGQKGEWSAWLKITTQHPMMNNIILIPMKFPIQNKDYLNLNEWITFCNENNMALNPYQQQRIFFLVKSCFKGRRPLSFVLPEGCVDISAFAKWMNTDLKSPEWVQFQTLLRHTSEKYWYYIFQ